MILLERIHNSTFCTFVHGKLFAVAFKIFVNGIRRNVMSFFKNLYAGYCPMRIFLQTN